MYEIIYTKKAAADIPKLKAAKLDGKAKALIELISRIHIRLRRATKG